MRYPWISIKQTSVWFVNEISVDISLTNQTDVCFINRDSHSHPLMSFICVESHLQVRFMSLQGISFARHAYIFARYLIYTSGINLRLRAVFFTRACLLCNTYKSDLVIHLQVTMSSFCGYLIYKSCLYFRLLYISCTIRAYFSHLCLYEIFLPM